MDCGISHLLKQHEHFLDEYEPLINKSVYYDVSNVNDREDVAQHVRVALIKSFKSRYKYENWDNVVRSIIKRRIKDYLKKSFRNSNKIASEYIDDYVAIDNEICYEEKGFNEFIVREQLDLIKRKVEHNRKIFDITEIEYFEVVCEIYDCGCIVDDELIMQNMGLDSSVSSDKKMYRKISKSFIEKMGSVR